LKEVRTQNPPFFSAVTPNTRSENKKKGETSENDETGKKKGRWREGVKLQRTKELFERRTKTIQKRTKLK